MATPPSVVVYKDAIAASSGTTRVLTQRTVATGDVVAVVGHGEDFSAYVSSLAKSAGTATIGTVTKQQEAGTSGHCANGLFTFTVTTGGTLTLTATFSASNTRRFTFWTYVATGCGGVGNTAKTTTSTTTITASLTTSANSYVLASAADWNATGGATTTLTPAGFTLDAHETDGTVDKTTSGSYYSSRGGHWDDSGGPGTVSYGVSVPTSAKYCLVVCELLGAAGGATLSGAVAATATATVTTAGDVSGLSGAAAVTATATVTAGGTVIYSAACAVTVTAAVAAASVAPGGVTVSFTFDDGTTDQQTAADLLAGHGWAGTFYIITNNIGTGGCFTAAQLQALQTAGHDVGGHTQSHGYLDGMTNANATTQISGSRDALITAGITNPVSFAYPFGAARCATGQICDTAGWDTARGYGGGTDTLPPIDGNYAIRSYDMCQIGGTLAVYQAIITAAEALPGNKWVVFTIHKVGATYNDSTSTISSTVLDSFLNWLDGRAGITVQSIAQAATPVHRSATVTSYCWDTHGDTSSFTLVSDTAAYTFGFEFEVTSACRLTGYHWPRDQAAADLPSSFALYQVTGAGTGTLVPGSETSFGTMVRGVTGQVQAVWNRIPVGGDVLLMPGNRYKACVYMPGGGNWYSTIAAYWTTGGGSGGFTRGPLHLYGASTSTDGQNTSHSGTGLIYPATSLSGACRPIDVEVSTGVPAYGDAAVSAAVTVTAAGTVTGGGATWSGDCAVALTGTVAAAGTVTQPGAAAVTATGTVTAAGTTVRPGDQTVPLAATVTTAGTVVRPGDQTVPLAATVTAAGLVTHPGDQTVPAVVTVTAAGAAERPGAVAVTATATVTAAGTVARPGDVPVTLTAAVTAGGQTLRVVSGYAAVSAGPAGSWTSLPSAEGSTTGTYASGVGVT